MKRILTLLIAVASLALVSPALAQQPAPDTGGPPEIGGGRGIPPGTSRRGLARGGPAARLTLMYDPATVTKVSGTVATLGTMPPGGRLGAMRTATLKTNQGNITVFLSPDWYLDQEKVSFKVGDRLEVTGSKVNFGEQPAIIAKDFKKAGGKTISIRDDQGDPVWAPQGPPPGPAQ
jgi:hypothetical protein